MSVAELLSPHTSSDAHAERRRARELFRHYHPASLPAKSSNNPDQEDLTSIKARLPHDTVLQGLAQLGVYRTNCRYGFISLFDHQNQYILAESTRCSSLLPPTQGRNSQLIGPCMLDWEAGWGKTAMKYFCAEKESLTCSTANVKADQTRFVVNDFSLDEKMCKKQIVKLYSQWRFVAEVPIKSSKGYVLGSVAVIDDKPRDGMSETDIAYLTEVARAVMDHLDLVKMRSSHTRSDQLGKGLGLFLEGKSSLREWWLHKNEHTEVFGITTDAERKRALEVRVDQELGPEPSPDKNLSNSPSGSDESTGSINASAPADQMETSCFTDITDFAIKRPSLSTTSTSERITREDSNHHLQPVTSTERGRSSERVSERRTRSTASRFHTPATPNPDNASLPQAVQSMFSRASNLLREAVEFEGAVFMNAARSRSDHKPLKSPRHEHTSTESASSNSDSEMRSANGSFSRVVPKMAGLSDNADPKLQHSNNEPCQILGYSTRQKSSLAGNASTSTTPTLTERILRHFLKTYPHGTVFTFDKDGVIASSSEEDHSSGGQELFLETESTYFKEHSSNSKARKRRRVDAEILLKLLPGVRSVAFYPLWDFHKERWYAGSLAWTTDHTRILEAEELTYFAAFGNSMMAELSRIEAIFADRSKSDFISSISHELRSPLHGVLGSAELLQDSSTGTNQDEMIRMIEICGRTLLDTMDHLLDFAKINNIAAKRSDKASKKQKAEGALGHMVALDLADLVEDVVGSIFAGHSHSNSAASLFHLSEGGHKMSPSKSPRPQVARTATIGDTHKAAIQNTMVIVNIEKRDSWVFLTQIGAWKRLLMNIFGNALKYTESGTIYVSLQSCQGTSSDSSNKPTIRLSVSDTGRGISSDYLEHHIFKPFSQENSLSVGTGLGMSIVQQIASAMGVIVEINSEKGRGTKVDLTATLEPVAGDGLQKRVLSTVSAAQECGRGRKACIVGFDEIGTSVQSSDDSRTFNQQLTLLERSLKNLLSEWLDMDVITASSARVSEVDLLFVHEAQLVLLKDAAAKSDELRRRLETVPMIVFCTENSKPTNMFPKTVQVSHPYGVRKIMVAVTQAFNGKFSNPSKPSITNGQPGLNIKHPDLPANGAFSPPTNKHLMPIRPSASPRQPSLHRPDQPNFAPPRSHTSPSLLRASAPTPAPTPKPTHILLVDDNEINLKLLSGFMRKLSCPYSTATNGAEAVKIYADSLTQPNSPNPTATTPDSNAPTPDPNAPTPPTPPTPPTTKPDIILMDISMPVMNGFEATREIRRLEKEREWAPATVIALTGLGSQDARVEARANGMSLFLTKPVSLRRLREILGRGEG